MKDTRHSINVQAAIIIMRVSGEREREKDNLCTSCCFCGSTQSSFIEQEKKIELSE